MEAIADLQQAADNIVHEARRKIRGMENQAVFHIWEKVFGLCLKDGLVNIFPPIPITEGTRKLLFNAREEKEEKMMGNEFPGTILIIKRNKIGGMAVYRTGRIDKN